VASVTGYSPTWISKIVWRYNDHGIECPISNEVAQEVEEYAYALVCKLLHRIYDICR